MYTLAALLPVATLFLCLSAAANFYIVVSQDVVTVAVVLEVHVLVATSLAVCACTKLTIFIAQLLCIMTQP